MFDHLIQNGKDPGRFVFDYIYFLRDMLFFKTTPALEDYMERAVVTDVFKQLCEAVDVDWIQAAIVELTECEQQIKWTNSPKIFVEISLLTITNRYQETAGQPVVSSAPTGDFMQLTERINQLEKELATIKQAPAANTKPAAPRRRETKRAVNKTYDIPYEKIRSVLEHAEKPALQKVQGIWTDFLNQLKAVNAPAHATIQDSKPAAASTDALVVAFKYEIHCSLFLDHKQTVESILANAMAHHLQILPIPEQDWYTLRQEYVNNQEAQQPKEETASENPLIEEARKLFGDDVVEVQE